MDQRDIEHQAEALAPSNFTREVLPGQVYFPHDPIQLAHFRKGPQPPREDAYDAIPFLPWWLFLPMLLTLGGLAWFMVYSAVRWALGL